VVINILYGNGAMHYGAGKCDDCCTNCNIISDFCAVGRILDIKLSENILNV